MSFPPAVQHAFSISGFLNMKHRGGALTILRPRRRFYFAIDEVSEQLLYYKQEADFTAHKEPVGSIAIDAAFITIEENNSCAFLLQETGSEKIEQKLPMDHAPATSVQTQKEDFSVNGKCIELEANNEKSCQCWLEAFSNRNSEAEKNKMSLAMLRHSKRSASLPDHESTYNTDHYRTIRRKFSTPMRCSRKEDYYAKGCFTNGLSELPGDEMDDWVTQWLKKEKFNRISDNDSEPVTPTSANQSRKNSCSESERAEIDDVEQLREITNCQRKKIEDMKNEMNALTVHLEQMRIRHDSSNGATHETLSAQNKFLNSEVLRISAKCDQLGCQLSRVKKEFGAVSDDLQSLRCDYVYAVQSAIRIPLHDNTALDVMSVKLIGGDAHAHRLVNLMNSARQDDPSLPTLQSLMQGTYADSFGFRVSFKEEPLALHYMATKLHAHYACRSKEFIENKLAWKYFLEDQSKIEITKETKRMCRNGIPNTLRATVWKILVNQQVDDLKNIYGRYYYRNLCNTHGGEEERKFSEAHQKQINLDLLRTMPNNVHFMSANSKGVTQLQQVLRAFCLHNPQIGYCQGMNFITATALLFVDPEDAFWFLIAITERYFDKSYFDSNLTGAQADQEVLKVLLETQSPSITKHLNGLDIDVASISLNWFIALFFDAVPFNTLLRIWDCFLLEGPKVLFRFALVLLGKHEEEIIHRTDAIGIMRVCKAASRLAFDEQAFVDMAFKIRNLPSRGEIKTLQSQFVAVLGEKLERRSKRATAFVSSMSPNSSNERLISSIFIDEFTPNNGFIVSGHHLLGKIAKITIGPEGARIKEIDIEFDCRVMSMCMADSDLAYVSLISGFLLLASIDKNDNWTVLWELKLPDVAVCLLQREGTLFAALANGTLTVFENSCERWPTNVQMWHLPLSSAPLANAVIHDDLLMVASACKLICIDAMSLTTLNTTHVASCSTGSGVVYFDKVTCMSESPYGIFLATDHSTMVQLWNETSCNLLYDMSFDHKTRKPSLAENESVVHIESVLYKDAFLWVGTSDGYVMVYKVESSLDSHESNFYRLKKYITERKPARTELRRSQRLGSLKEKREEDPDRELLKMDRRPRRVSISIDRERQQYSVSLAREEEHVDDDDVRRSSSSRINSCSTKAMRPFSKGFSADSAVSVFSSESCEQPSVDKTTDRTEELFPYSTKTTPISTIPPHHSRISSTDSSCTSMEYDDMFELYSDEERSRRRVAITSSKKYATLFNKKVQLKRKDLTFDEPYVVAIQTHGKEMNDSDTTPITATVQLSLLMKLKISDTSVRRIVSCGKHVLTCSGEIGADEAVLLWSQDEETSLWFNDPVSTMHEPTKTSKA